MNITFKQEVTERDAGLGGFSIYDVTLLINKEPTPIHFEVESSGGRTRNYIQILGRTIDEELITKYFPDISVDRWGFVVDGTLAHFKKFVKNNINPIVQLSIYHLAADVQSTNMALYELQNIHKEASNG